MEVCDLNVKQLMGPECFELVDVPSESHGSTSKRRETDPTGCFQTMNSNVEVLGMAIHPEEQKAAAEEHPEEPEHHESRHQLRTSYYQTGADNEMINLSKLSEVLVDSNDPYVRTNPYVETNKRSTQYNEEPISPSALAQTNEQAAEEIPANVHIEQVIADMDQIKEIKLKTEGSSSLGKGTRSDHSKSEAESSPQKSIIQRFMEKQHRSLQSQYMSNQLSISPQNEEDEDDTPNKSQISMKSAEIIERKQKEISSIKEQFPTIDRKKAHHQYTYTLKNSGGSDEPDSSSPPQYVNRTQNQVITAGAWNLGKTTIEATER